MTGIWAQGLDTGWLEHGHASCQEFADVATMQNDITRKSAGGTHTAQCAGHTIAKTSFLFDTVRAQVI